MSANVEGRGASMPCSSSPAEGRFSDSSMTIVADTLNVCRTTQSMIDIAAKQLFGLRQYGTSEDLIQKEICECESRLIRLFSRMLIAKSKLRLQGHISELDAFPNTEQWLQIVGFTDRSLREKLAATSVTDMLSLTESQLEHRTADCGTTREETHRLVLAVSNLRHCIAQGGKPNIDLHWSAYKPSIGSSPKFIHNSRPSTSSLSAVDTTLSPPSPSPSPDPSSSIPSSPFQCSSPAEARRHHTPPPTPPIIKPSSKGGRFPTTPPPQRRNKLHPEAFQPLTKSKSHESQLSVKVNQEVDLSKYAKKKPCNLTLVNSSETIPHKRSVGEDGRAASSGQSSPLLSSPFRTSSAMTCRSPGQLKGNQLEVPTGTMMKHVIEHKFQSKVVLSSCDLCRQRVFRGKVCKYCKAKFHRDCASKAPPSCGLSDELVDKILTLSRDNANWPLSSGSTTEFTEHATMAPDSSSATSSCNSSTPSSPAVYHLSSSSPSGYPPTRSADYTGHSQTFQFPDPCVPLSVTNESDEALGSSITASHTSPNTDFVSTVMSNDSDKSDVTLIDTGSSSERMGMLDRIDSMESAEDISGGQGLERINSISVTLREWDIPYQELDKREKIGVGRFGTVYKGNWHGDVAIKELNLDEESDSDNTAQLQAFKLEVATLKKTRHENLVLFMGACMTPPKLAIVTSLCKGPSLYTQLHKRKDIRTFGLAHIAGIASQIAQGMGYLHAKEIIHKDLKSKNVFLESGINQTAKIVITDFGLFNVTKLCQGSRKGSWLSIPPGWLCYLPPEVIVRLQAGNQPAHELPFSFASDVYSFGTIWYELLCLEFPFQKQPPESIIWQVGKGMKQSLTHIQASRDVKDLLVQCWAYTPKDRPEFKDLLHQIERLPKKKLSRSPSHPVQLSRSVDSVLYS